MVIGGVIVLVLLVGMVGVVVVCDDCGWWFDWCYLWCMF